MADLIPVLNSWVKMRWEDEEWILRAPNGSRILLNDVGMLITRLCDCSRTLTEINSLVGKVFKAKKGDMKSDIAAFLKDLEKANCIHMVAGDYEPPSCKLITPTGTVEISKVDKDVFDTMVSYAAPRGIAGQP